MAFFRLERKDAASVARASTANGMWLPRGQPYVSQWNTERVVRDAYERSIWVFRGVDTIATNGARLPVKIRVGDEANGRYDETDPLIRLLNTRPNPELLESAAQFRYRLLTQLVLSKPGVFVELVRSRGGELTGLYLLPPQYTRPLPDPDKFLSGFRVTLPGASRSFYDLPPENVLWIRKPHPTDPYSGVTPLESAGIAIDLDFYARLYNRNFMQNDGRPGGLVAVKGRLNADDAAELKRRFAGGPQNAGRTSVVEADDVSWVDTATSPRDAQYVESLAASKQDILLALGTPESVLGNASGRTFDNAAAEFEIFWRVTMLPYLDLVASAFDSVTAGGWDDDRYVVHDTSSVSVLHRDAQIVRDKKLAELQAGGCTIDEYRDAVGATKLDVAGARVLWLGVGGKVPIGASEEDVAAAEKLTTIGAAMPGSADAAAPSDPYAAPAEPSDPYAAPSDPYTDGDPYANPDPYAYEEAGGGLRLVSGGGGAKAWRLLEKSVLATLAVGDVVDVDEALAFDTQPAPASDLAPDAAVAWLDVPVEYVAAGARLEVVARDADAVRFRLVQ